MRSAAPVPATIFIAAEEEWIYCPISQQVMTNPVHTSCCEKLYEKDSLEGWLKQNTSCPNCRSESIQHSPALKLHKEIINKCLIARPELVAERYLTAPLLNQLIEKNELSSLFKDAIAVNGLQNVAASAYLARGKSRLCVKDYVAALNDAKHALEWEPNNHSAQKLLARAWTHNKQFAEALPLWSKLIAENPQSEKLKLERAITLLNSGDLQKAREESSALIHAKCNSPKVYSIQARALFNLEHYNEAKNALQHAINLNAPDTPSLRFHLGHCNYYLGNTQEAIQDFTKAMQEGYKKSDCLFTRAKCYKQLKQYKIARQDLEAALALEKTANTLYLLAQVLVLQEKHDQALEPMKAALQLNPTIIEGYPLLSMIYFNLNRLQEAQQTLDQYPANEMPSMAFHEMRAKIHDKMGNFELSVVDLNHCMRLEPKSAWLHYQRATLLIKINKEDEALADLDAAINLDVTLLEALSLRARLHTKNNRHEAAIKDYTTLLPCLSNPEVKAKYHLLKAQSSAKLHDIETSLTNLEIAMQSDRYKTAANWEWLADMRNSRNDPATLLAYEALLKCQPELELAKIHKIIQFYLNNLLYAKAFALAEAALLKHPNDNKLLIFAARSLINQSPNKHVQAFRYLDKVTATDNPEALYLRLTNADTFTSEHAQKLKHALMQHLEHPILLALNIIMNDLCDKARSEQILNQLARNNGHELVHEMIARYYLSKQDYYLCVEATKKLIQLNPADLSYLKRLIQAQWLCGLRNEAQETFESLKARILDAELVKLNEIWFNQLKKINDSKELREIAEANWRHQTTAYSIAEINEKNVNVVENIVKVKPTIMTCNKLSDFFIARNGLDEAHFYLRLCRKLDPDAYAQYTRSIVETLKCQNDYMLAFNYAWELVNRPEVIGKDHCMLAQLASSLNRFPLAIQYYHSAMQLDLTLRARIQPALIYCEWKINQDHEAAIEKLTASLANNAGYISDHWLPLASAYFAKGNNSEALKYLNDYIAFDSKSASAYLLRARTHLNLNDLQQAKNDANYVSRLPLDAIHRVEFDHLKAELQSAIQAEVQRRVAERRQHQLFPTTTTSAEKKPGTTPRPNC